MGRVLVRTIVAVILAGVSLLAQSRIPSRGPFTNSYGFDARFLIFSPRPFVFHGLSQPVFVTPPVFWPVGFYSQPSYPVVEPAVPQGGDARALREVESQIESLRDEIRGLREDRLRDEIDRLREEVELRRESRERLRDQSPRAEESTTQPRSRWRPQPVPRGQNPEEAPTLTLVFRDGHQRQIRDYALVGQTLWDFTEDHATRILLSALDLDATVKLNEERGVEFSFPTPQITK